MQTHELKRINPLRRSTQVGRGGKRGKTSGRGGKGQTARAGAKMRPEIRDMIKKLPKLRGRGVNSFRSFAVKAVPLNVSVLEENFKSGDEVNPKILVERGIVRLFKGKVPEVKILGEGELTKKLSITDCLFSGSAKTKIEKSGGKIAGEEKPKAEKVVVKKKEVVAKP